MNRKPEGWYEGALPASCEHMRILPQTSGRPWQIPLYPLRVKVGKNPPYHVVDFRSDTTLFVAPRPSIYPDNLYSG
jgi:hypothetical protein